MNLYFENLSKSYHGKTIFENINGKVDEQDKIGLIGVNGIGKTTLVKLLSGLESSDGGNIRYSPAALKILYIEQYPEFDKEISVYDEVCKTLNNDRNINKDTVIEKVFNDIGLAKELWTQKAASLSGGEKTKLMLCKVLVSEYDLLIMDEPTNHLDMGSCQWLEEYLSKLNKTLLVISHDRFFLDRVVNEIWELTSTGLKPYEGNYSDYKIQKEIELKNITREYQKQQSRIQSLEKMIVARKNWFASAHNAAGQNDFYRSKAKKHTSVIKAKERELERLENSKIDKPEKTVTPAFDIINKNIIMKKLPPVLVRTEKVSKTFGERTIFKNISVNIRRGDKIALLGSNGSGKTTLLKIINNTDADYEGSVTVNPSVRIGYFAQELDNLNHAATVIDDVLSTGATVGEVRLLLACLLFTGGDVDKRIGSLSMGEQCRAAMAKLILSGANLLILDEPTNYMDIVSKEKIEEVLEDFRGSLLFVSHDRYFTGRIANRILEIRDQAVRCYEGNYDYYLSKSRHEQMNANTDGDLNQISDNIRRLECQLAFISGKLAEPAEEAVKEHLNAEFIRVARELNQYKETVKRLQK